MIHYLHDLMSMIFNVDQQHDRDTPASIARQTPKQQRLDYSPPIVPPLLPLHLHLDTALRARRARLQRRKEVGDIIPRMSVQASAQPLLIEVMGDETDGAAEDEQTVQDTHLEVVLRLLGAEGAAVAHQIHEAHGDGTVNVEDQVVLLGGGDALDGEGVVEHLAAGEALLDELLDELDAEIGVVARLDLVADTWDELVLLPHGVDEVTWAETLVVGAGELLGGAVEGTTESRSDGEETGHEGGDEILAGTGGDDGVHGTGHGGAVVGSQHENHLEELAPVVWETATEPEEGHDTADSDILSEDIRDWHSGVQKLLATVIGNGGDEGSGLSDQAKLLRPRVIERDLGHDWLGLWLDAASLDEGLVDGAEESGHLLEGLGDVESGLLHGLVLVGSGLELRVGERASVSELNLGLEHARARSDRPGNNWLGDGSVLDGLDDAVLLNSTNLTQQ